MKWSDKYATGIDRIDGQHKTIFKMVEDFRDALDHEEGEKVYAVFLKSLNQYFRHHIGFEERCMDECRCPIANECKREHTRFVNVLSDYQQRFETFGFDRADARSLADKVDKWLSDHICRIDRELNRYQT